MEVTVTIDNVRKQVSVERRDGVYVVTIDGRRHTVTDVNAVEGTLAFLVDRNSHVARVSTGDGGVRVSIGGRNYRMTEEEMDADRPGAVAGGGDGRVEAPMPGNIVAVHVAAGDEVEAGQPLVVLESMKMQNELASPIDGVVKRLNCAPGRQVAYGAVLAEVVPKERR